MNKKTTPIDNPIAKQRFLNALRTADPDIYDLLFKLEEKDFDNIVRMAIKITVRFRNMGPKSAIELIQALGKFIYLRETSS